MADRGLLHKSKLGEFKQWLIDNGWQIEDHAKNNCAVLRARNEKISRHPLIVYERDKDTPHFTVQERHYWIVRMWLRDKKKGMTAKRKLELFDGLVNHITELVSGCDLISTLHCIGFTDDEIKELDIETEEEEEG